MSEKIDFKWDEEGNGKRGLTETVKKLVASGLSSAFMTEETLRSYLSDVKLPTDVLSQIIRGAKRSRDELINKAGTELSKIISRIDMVEEAKKFLLENKISFKAEINFSPKDESKDEPKE